MHLGDLRTFGVFGERALPFWSRRVAHRSACAALSAVQSADDLSDIVRTYVDGLQSSALRRPSLRVAGANSVH